MNRAAIYLVLLSLCLGCNRTKEPSHSAPITNGISIFEIYLEDSTAVDHMSNFLRDTLKLPVEWEPFDIFRNNVVYDAAFYLGNTTLELLAVNPPDTTIKTPAKYNRILFHSKNLDSTSAQIAESGISYSPTFDFNIVSNNEQLKIGRQINLDSLSTLSNIHLAFWEYDNAGYNFIERTIKGSNLEELKTKLETAWLQNPMGITGLKEIHLSATESVIQEWSKLLGESVENRWVLTDGPIISYSVSSESVGVDWITLGVKNMDSAKKFLSDKNLLAQNANRTAMDKSQTLGLQIFVEEQQ